ncbi:MAG TPA: hypothetical protein VMU17_05585, partial [Elusimicrobiota bacterium]|nr:hypothetical protein [Elusimicrobiota bacterium]
MRHATPFSKSLAILINVALVGTSFADVGMPGLSSAAAPDFVRALTPPTKIGYVMDSFQGRTDKPVVLIQDLHGNYSVQKNIVNILKFLQPKVAQGGRPMVLGIEGAWGPIDLAQVRQAPEKARGAAADFLLIEAEISGMEHFAAMSPT